MERKTTTKSGGNPEKSVEEMRSRGLAFSVRLFLVLPTFQPLWPAGERFAGAEPITRRKMQSASSKVAKNFSVPNAGIIHLKANMGLILSSKKCE